VRVDVAAVDLIERSLSCVYRETLAVVQKAAGDAGQKA